MPINPSDDRSSRIHRALLDAVVEQRLPPGMKLSEDQLGRIFGASRTLVRAALQSLAHDGIVTIARHRGAFVASPTVADAREVFEARRMIEAVTVARAAQLLSSDNEGAVIAVLDEGARAMAEGDRARTIRLSGEFHLAIARVAGQRVLHGFLLELLSRSSLVIALYGHSNHSACGQAEHRRLLAALRRHDGAEAGRLMQQHLDSIEADLDFARHEQPAIALSDVFTLPFEPAGAPDLGLGQRSSWLVTTKV